MGEHRIGFGTFIFTPRQYFYFCSSRFWDSGNKIPHLLTEHTYNCGTGFHLLSEGCYCIESWGFVVCFNPFLCLFEFGRTWVWQELFFPRCKVLYSVGVWINSLKDLFSGLPNVYITDIWACYFINEIPGLELNAFLFFLTFIFKKLRQFRKVHLSFWFSKLVLLYRGKSVKLGILKHVSLRLNMISKHYFYMYFASGMVEYWASFS